MNLKTYFLGANTPHGFYSLFNELYNPEKDNKIYIIKGGPGTGKSSLMKKVASAAESKGYIAERIPCSSDPLSLDAVIIPELNISIADATSPHIINPVYPGVCEHTIDLSQCWDKTKLKANSSVIKKITKDNSNAHKKCIRFLKAAAVVDAEINDIIMSICDHDKINRFTKRLISTELKNVQSGTKRNIFLSAVTPLGIAVQYDTLYSACDKVLNINDKYGCISDKIIKAIDNHSEMNNLIRTNCLCPMNPEKKIEHIMFDNQFAIFTSNTYHPIINKSYKTIHAERFIIKDKYNKVKNKLSFLNKTKLELIGESIKCLEEAKALHDILESYYIAAMDFSKVSAVTEYTIKEIFS